MAYIVLALGAFLSIGGAISIYRGAEIVEVERGWTGVIAGSTSLTGGILTIALGLILKTLLDIRRAGALNPARPAEPTDAAAIVAPSLVPATAAVPGADLDSGLLAAFLAPKATEAPPHRAEPVALAPEALSLQADPAPREATLPLEEIEALAADPAPSTARPKVSFKRPPAPEPEPVAPEPPMPAMDDWLDRAFSSLDNDLPPPSGAERASASPAPSLAPERPVPPPPEADIDAAVETHGETVLLNEPLHPQAPAAPEPEQASPHESAVIGRYEADGTSYVMFADGSIEAQSEAGVYRFGSMTELKSFIEGTG